MLHLIATVLTGPRAHGDEAADWSTFALITVLAGLAAAYGRGVHELWIRRGVGAVVSHGRVAAFGAGIAILVLALSPIVHGAAERSFAGHMLQHMLLLVAAGPLLAFGGVGLPLSMAAPLPLRRWLGRWRRWPAVRWLRRPAHLGIAAGALHTAVLWIWHLPGSYLAALHSDAVHAVEHISFVLAAWLLWSTALAPGAQRLSAPAGFLLLFATGMPAAALGALLTLAPAPLFPASALAPYGGDPLRDQQLAGLIMWIPMDVVVLSAAVALFLRWLTGLDRSMPADRDRQPDDSPKVNGVAR